MESKNNKVDNQAGESERISKMDEKDQQIQELKDAVAKLKAEADEVARREKAVSRREDEASKREEQIRKSSEELESQKKEQARIKSNNSDEKARNERLSSELAKREKSLNDREQDISKREIEAEMGFAAQQSKVAAKFSGTLNQLRKDISDAEVRLAEINAECDNSTAAREHDIVVKAKMLADDLIGQASRQLEEYRVNSEKLEAERQDVQRERDVFEKLRENLNEQINIEVERRHGDLIAKSNEDEEELQKLHNELEQKRKELSEQRKIRMMQMAGRSLDDILKSEADLLAQAEEQQEKIYQLEEQVKAVSENNIKLKRFDQVVKERDELLSKISDLRDELGRNEMELSECRILKTQKECAIRQRDTANAAVKALDYQISALQQQVDKLQTLAERPAERDARIHDITSGRFVQKNIKLIKEIDEIEWLGDISKGLRDAGIIISPRLLCAFHTSLKTAEWSPITVLAGVSGTGKSLLPKLYARFGGLYFLPLAVQPDWDSSQSLFGYFNAIDNRFNATTLLKAMVQFQKEAGEDCLDDSMMLVLLDEMNLAHVELYFSELLSKLEERRGEKDNSSVSIEIDLGSNFDPYTVNLCRNILWVGTMNEDETTKTLSDKVIDRSNMISFPSPKHFARRTTADIGEKSEKMLSKKVWDNWVDNAIEFSDDDENIAEYVKCVEDINNAMEHVGRAVGHRVWQAVEHYISNHPAVIAAKKANDESDEYRTELQNAFEEAVVFKIIPKLRGIEITEETRSMCFKPIEELLSKSAPGLVSDYNEALKNDQFVWRSSDYLEFQNGLTVK